MNTGSAHEFGCPPRPSSVSQFPQQVRLNPEREQVCSYRDRIMRPLAKKSDRQVEFSLPQSHWPIIRASAISLERQSERGAENAAIAIVGLFQVEYLTFFTTSISESCHWSLDVPEAIRKTKRSVVVCTHRQYNDSSPFEFIRPVFRQCDN